MTDQTIFLDGQIVGDHHEKFIRIYFEDTDTTGIVYHANYVRYFERARTDFIRLLDIHHSELAKGAVPLAFAVTALSLRYRSPARVDDLICVKSWFRGLKGARMFIDQQVWRDETLLCEGEVEVVLIDQNGRPKRPPEDFKTAILKGLATEK
jgi:acyl-CoA thioester hydrolase